MSEPLRIALTVPGAVALGAYEAGALAALIKAAQNLRTNRERVIDVDVIGSSSSGSLTALLAARCLLEGLDPVAVLSAAWVEQASLRRLLGWGFAAPLSFRSFRADAAKLLSTEGADEKRHLWQQSTPITLSLAVQNLRGLEYRPAAVSQDYSTITHLDWMEYLIESDVPVKKLTEPRHKSVLDAVLASAANQLAFPSQLLAMDDRIDQEVRNWPPGNQFWCTDAAILDREPISRTVLKARAIDRTATPADRLYIVVEPQPRVPGIEQQWADPNNQPSWLQVLGRSLAIAEAQSVFDDIDLINDHNKRFAAVEKLSERLGPTLDALPEEISNGLAAVLDDRDGPPDPAVRLSDLFRRKIAAAADVVGRHQMRLEVISPDLVDLGIGKVNDKLAGEFLFRFGGLLEKRLRRSDFDLGYKSTLNFLESGALGNISADVLDEVKDAYPRAVDIGPGWTPPEPSVAARLQLIGLLYRIGVVGAHDVVVGLRARSRKPR